MLYDIRKYRKSAIVEAVEERIKEFIASRTKHLQVFEPGWQAILKKYYTPECAKSLEPESVFNSEAEQIMSTTVSRDTAIVVTTGSTGGKWNARYHLGLTDDVWLIARQEWECFLCKGTGKAKKCGGRKCEFETCRICHGRGWK